MEADPESKLIRARATELSPAIEHALSQAIAPARSSGEPPFLLGFDAEAADLAGVVEATYSRMTALLAEHDAAAIACMVNGLHATDDGHRVWGTLECVITRDTLVSTRVDDVRVGQKEAGDWEVTFRMSQDLDDDLLGRRSSY